MRLLLTADWQANVRNLDECRRMLTQLLGILKGGNIDAVIHLGDLKDAFNPVDVRVTNFLVGAAVQIQRFTSYIVLLGNHDRSGPIDTAESFLPVLEGTDCVVIEKTMTLPWKGVEFDFVPYIRDGDVQWEAFKTLLGGKRRRLGFPRLLFFHCDVAKSRQDVFSTSRADRNLDEVLPAYQGAYGGHIHFQQEMARNFWYVGSPFCQDWGEVNQPKGFLLVETGTNGEVTTTPIKSEIPGWYDPLAPDFDPPKSWKGARVRLSYKTPEQRAAVLAEGQGKYQGAEIVLRDSMSGDLDPVVLDTSSSDEKLIREYLEQKQLFDPGDRGAAITYLTRSLEGRGGVGIPKVQFEWVKAQEVLCFEEAELNLNRPGLTLITGINQDWNGKSNGSGKSSLLGLPTLALVGATPKGQDNDRWRRRGSRKISSVKLRLKLNDGRSLEIHRTRNPGQVNLSLDGRNITMGDRHQTQRKIVEYTGLTWEVLSNSIYMGQQEVATILHGTDRMRKDLFAQFQGLERFSRAMEPIKRDINRVLTQINEATNDLAIYRDRLTQERLEGKALSNQAGVKAVTKEEVGRIKTKLLDTIAHINRLRKKLKLLDRERDSINGQREKTLALFAIESEAYEMLKRSRAKIQGLKAGVCPTCGSTLQEKRLKVQIAQVEEDLERQKKRTLVAQSDDQAKLRELELILKQRRKLEAKCMELEGIRPQLQESYHRWAAARRVYLELKERINQSKIRCQELWRKIEIYDQGIAALNLDHQFLLTCLEVVSRNGLPAFLCSRTVPKLNRAAKEFGELFSGGMIEVQFVIDDGDIDVKINNLYGGEYLEDQSQGETRIAALITAFAFRAILVRSNLLILDEPGEGLDSENAANFAGGLSKVISHFGSVFIISHNPFVLGQLEPDHHLQVIKRNRVAMIKEL